MISSLRNALPQHVALIDLPEKPRNSFMRSITNVQEIPYKLKMLTKSLKFLSIAINNTPFIVQESSIQLFEDVNRQYKDLTKRGNSIILEYNETHFISEDAPIFIEDLEYPLGRITRAVQKILTFALTNIKNESMLFSKLTLVKQSYESPIVNFELFDKLIVEFQKTVQGLRKGLSENPRCRKLLHRVKIVIGEDDFEESLQTFSKIKKIKDRMTSFKFQNRQTDDLPSLTKEEYLDIIFLNEIFKAKIVKVVAERLLNITSFINYQHEERIRFLKRYLCGQFSSIIRCFRMKQIYQLWEKHLINKALSDEPTWRVAIENIKTLTYQKKFFLQQAFEHQKANLILKQLETFLMQFDMQTITPGQIYQEILQDKNELQIKIQRREIQIKANQTYIQSLFSHLILIIIQQPDYVLMQMLAKKATNSLNKIPIIILEEDISKIQLGSTNLEELTAHISGLGSLAVTFLTTKTGFYYHILTALTKAITSQIDYLIYFGEYLDKITKRIGIRLDEQGILEKDRYIRWLFGFLLNLGMNYKRPIPGSIAYLAATSCGYIATKIVDEVSERLEFSETTNIATRQIANMVVFSLAYKYGYKLGNYFTDNTTNKLVMTPEEACKILNLNSRTPSMKDIRSAYHRISLEKHPDRMRSQNEVYYMENKDRINEEFGRINYAYELLRKKNI